MFYPAGRGNIKDRRSSRSQGRAANAPYYVSAGFVSTELLTNADKIDTHILDVSGLTAELAPIGADASPIFGFTTENEGQIRRLLIVEDAMYFKHNATSFILPGGDSIRCVVGDVAEFYSLGSGNWRCWRYTRSGVTPPPTYAPLVADYATTASLGTENTDYSYGNGSVQGTIMHQIQFTGPAAQTADGGTPAVGQYVLVKSESGAARKIHGLYEVLAKGDGVSVPEQWRRAISLDTSHQFPGTHVYVANGTANAGTLWFCTNTSAPAVGTDAITFQAAAPGAGTVTYPMCDASVFLAAQSLANRNPNFGAIVPLDHSVILQTQVFGF